MTGWRSSCSKRLIKSGSSRPAGSGPTITNGRTWPSEASPQNRSWPWRPDLYFCAQLGMGGLPSVRVLAVEDDTMDTPRFSLCVIPVTPGAKNSQFRPFRYHGSQHGLQQKSMKNNEKWWALQDLNLRPTDYESAALTN